MDILNKKEAGVQPQAPEQTPEKILVPEVTRETIEQHPASEQEDVSIEQQRSAQESVIAASIPSTTPVVAYVKDELAERIEDVLEEDMTDLFLAMSPLDQQKFKEKGEETVSKIRELLSHAKVQTKKIFDLIRTWLKLIPGVNRFYLEQEAKIKTDKIKHLSDL